MSVAGSVPSVTEKNIAGQFQLIGLVEQILGELESEHAAGATKYVCF